MQKLPKVLAGIAVIIAVIIAGLALGWFASKNVTPPQKPDNRTSPPETAASNPAPPPPVALNTGITTTVVRNHGMQPMPPATNIEASAPASNLITNWEDRIDDILADDTDDTNKVKVLFGMFPRLPPDGQEEVAQHLSNLVEDDNYTPLGQMLKDAKLPEPVLDVLLSDVLNRPNSIKLPLLLDVASNPDHAKAGEAKDLLELYLDEDYGTDWEKWRDKTKSWLKDNPD
jgi:hypothetical protein